MFANQNMLFMINFVIISIRIWTTVSNNMIVWSTKKKAMNRTNDFSRGPLHTSFNNDRVTEFLNNHKFHHIGLLTCQFFHIIFNLEM